MKNMTILILVLALCREAQSICANDIKDQLSTATHYAKKGAPALSRAAENKYNN